MPPVTATVAQHFRRWPDRPAALTTSRISISARSTKPRGLRRFVGLLNGGRSARHAAFVQGGSFGDRRGDWTRQSLNQPLISWPAWTRIKPPKRERRARRRLATPLQRRPSERQVLITHWTLTRPDRSVKDDPLRCCQGMRGRLSSPTRERFASASDITTRLAPATSNLGIVAYLPGP